jgi:hypothetical protein
MKTTMYLIKILNELRKEKAYHLGINIVKNEYRKVNILYGKTRENPRFTLFDRTLPSGQIVITVPYRPYGKVR